LFVVEEALQGKRRRKSMQSITLRLADPERDFGQLAALFSSEQDEPESEPELKLDYETHQARIIRLMVAEDAHGELLGFNWATRNRVDSSQAYIYVIVKPERRGQGAGRLLYADLEEAAQKAGVKKLRVSIRDNSPEVRAFAERRDFTERSHGFAMELDLAAFDDRPYDAIISRLKGEGFRFTSMEELGDTEETQRKLYTLNNTTDLATPGSDGIPAWDSFEDFQKRVCQADWYKPAGQMVVIDSATGAWAALSAITRMQGCDYAYNLHTGVDLPYRGRKLGQAAKILALRYARQVLKVNTVRTQHNTKNLPMIAIDRKFGYKDLPGTFSMEKLLE
jgi:GNAT superfamily N-acetyltransferase